MIQHCAESKTSRNAASVVVLGFLLLNSVGCNGSSSAVTEKEAVRLAKEHFVQEFPNIIYDDVIIASGDGGDWIAEFKTIDGRNAGDLEDGKTWLESPVFIRVDESGKCAVVEDD